MLVAVFALAFSLPALAGGWATATLDEPVDEFDAGTPTTIGFTLLQHGETPTDWTTTFVEATNHETGETLRFDATPAGEVGHWTAEITLPSPGTWDWQIQTEELFIESSFTPLTVTGSVIATTTSGMTPAEVQKVVSSTVGSELETYDKQLASLSGQIDGLEKTVTSLAGERDTLQKHITNLEDAFATARADGASDSSTSPWIAGFAGAGGAIVIGLIAFAVARWRGVAFGDGESVAVPAR
jgi:hypothetical protein